MSEKEKEYYSSREAASLLGVAVSTVQQWTNNGILKAWTTGGGHRRISRDSVEEIINQQLSVSSQSDNNSSLSVIVVEDDAQLRKLYKKHINSWDLDVHVTLAKDGYQGLIKVGQSLPDIMITDLMMPNIDGFQMVKVLKEIPELNECLVIVVSGLDEDEVLKNGGLPDGVIFFRKPISFEELELLFRERINLNESNVLTAAS